MKAGSIIIPAAILVFLGVLIAGCAETFKLVWRKTYINPEKKVYSAPNFRFSVIEWPDGSNPMVGVQVQREKYWVETAVQVRRQYKKYENRKPEPVVPKKEVKEKLARITGKTDWVPAPGINITFRLGDSGQETQVLTDEQGIARFDVSPFAEQWVEGKDLVVEVGTRLKSILGEEPWKKIKGKHPKDLPKLLDVEEKDFSEPVQVSRRTLERIFEKR